MLILVAEVLLDPNEILWCNQETQYWGGKTHLITKVRFKRDPKGEQTISLSIPISDFFATINKEVALVHAMENASDNK